MFASETAEYMTRQVTCDPSHVGDRGHERGSLRVTAARRVIVSSNCQTAGIAAALQVIFPRDEFIPIPLPSIASLGGEEAFVTELVGMRTPYDRLQGVTISRVNTGWTTVAG